MKPASVLAVHACLRSALRYALVRRLIDRNPADGAPPPRATRPAVRVLDADDCRRLLDAVAGDELEALYVLAVTTGARLGELLGLRWIDVDLASARLAIRQALVRTGGKWSLDEPKTDQSRRSVALSRRAAKALQTHRIRQQRCRLAAGPAWTDHDLLFTDDWGEPLYGAHITERHFKPLLRRAGLPVVRFHDLRHSAATLMLARGVHAKVVSEMLGHASVVLTLDTYSHVIPSMQAIVAEQMDLALG